MLMAATAVAVGTLGIGAQPAAADTYSPCAGWESTVHPGDTYFQHSVSCVERPVCGETWSGTYDVRWYMTVTSSGITVKYINLIVSHGTAYQEITIGRKWVEGNNTSYAWDGWNQIPSTQTTWSKTLDVAPDKFFPKRSDGTVQFALSTTSSKANGCSVGWRTFTYKLKIV
ncbi:hypothetical protein AB0B31_33085 [Catellatospora citrea]|uniref:hypothetical protein n=1 Tax=Catellatospora citrea TaxID=53366 RepID=UPI0033F25187